MYSTALVALDLSPAEQPLLDCLHDLRKWGVGRVVLAHVIRVGYMQGAGYGNEQQYIDEIASRVQPLRAGGLEVEIVVRAAGVPADDILTMAREKSADLIVIGSRSRNMIRGLFLGSVAREVIRKTELPLLLEWIEPTAEATAARCEAVCRESLRHLMLATDFSRHAQAAENGLPPRHDRRRTSRDSGAAGDGEGGTGGDRGQDPGGRRQRGDFRRRGPCGVYGGGSDRSAGA